MAGSRIPGPLQCLPGPYRIPARSPGPLGVLDQGDSNFTSLLGDTPGPLGWRDHADPTLPWLGDLPNCAAGTPARAADGTPVVTGSDLPSKAKATKDPALWKAWTPPAGYAVLYELIVANEGNLSYMYLDTKNKVTVGIGCYLPGVEDAKKLRFYNRDTQAVATAEEIEADYKAVQEAKPDPEKFPKGRPASHYEQFTKLDMTPTDIGERWLADVKTFQKQLPSYFKDFSSYPSDAKQALTDIAYQYGASGASKNAAGGKLKEAAESGDWQAAADLCAKLEGQASRNTKRKQLFEAAAKAAPKQ